ncbi:MAG TPA: response regulator [Candidatus Limivicinus faecipullorum]|nr:response regulator [Candidatus Limivicinus faecipullorum]
MIFQERSYSVLIVSASRNFNTAMASLLPVSEFWPVSTVGSVASARRELLERAFDIVIINAPLPDDLGSALAVDVSTHSQAAALLLVKSDIYDEVYSEVMEYGVFTLSKPTSAQLLSQYLKILCTARERIRRLEGKQQSVEEKIEEIRLVNHAKWLLIECLSMSEAEAQRYIEKQAMDLRISKRQMAENVIKTYE